MFLSNAHPLSQKRHRSLLFIQYIYGPICYPAREGLRLPPRRYSRPMLRCSGGRVATWTTTPAPAATGARPQLASRRPRGCSSQWACRRQRAAASGQWAASPSIAARRPAAAASSAADARAPRRRRPPRRRCPHGSCHLAETAERAAAPPAAARSPGWRAGQGQGLRVRVGSRVRVKGQDLTGQGSRVKGHGQGQGPGSGRAP